MKKSTNLPIAIIFGAIVIGGSIIYANPSETDSQIIKKGGENFIIESTEPVTLTVVSDKNCKQCETKKIEEILKMQLGGPVAVRRIDYSQPEGKDIVKQYGGAYLPFLLLGEEITEKENFGHLAHHIVTKTENQYLVDLEKMRIPVGKYLNVDYYESDDPDAPKITISETEKNLGTVKLSEGKVQVEFAIKNDGNNPLTLLGLDTSCGCTSAKIVTPSDESPAYQMAGHGEPIKWRGELLPGETGEIVVIYDPSIHPDLSGDVMREVYIKTNDPNNSQLTIKIFVSQSPN